MKTASGRPSSLGWRKLRLVAILLVLGGVIAVAAGTGSAAATANPPSNQTRPTIAGKAQDGQTLTAAHGRWQNHVNAYAYQWLRCDVNGANCSKIVGADSQTYTLGSADVGHTLRVDVTARNADGTGTAESDPTARVAAVGSAPVSVTKATVSGSPQVGSTLVVQKGTWSGVQPITLSYQWQRCDSSGNNCSDVSGATGTSYNVTSGDQGNTLRVKEIAKNAKGSNSATTSTTAVVVPAKGGAIPVAQVAAPERLIVDKVVFTPSPLQTRRSLVARFHVSDTRGFSVQGALVYALGLPYGWVRNGSETPTNSSGWATVVLQPTQALPLRRGTALVVFVRARKPGDNLLAGVSSRRLVQARVR